MPATISTMPTGPTTADMIVPGQSMLVNGHVVAVYATDFRLSDATVHVIGTEGGVHRSFRLDPTDPVILL